MQELAVHLLSEVAKGPESFWAIYLRQLPGTYDTACCFTSHEAAEAQVWSIVSGDSVKAAYIHTPSWNLLHMLNLESLQIVRSGWKSTVMLNCRGISS